MQLVQPFPYDDAVQKFGSKSLVASTLNSAAWSDLPTALSDRAFFSSTITSARFLQRAQDFINDFLSSAVDSDGHLIAGSRAQFIKELQDFAISEGLGPINPDLAGTIQDITSADRLGLIFDTNTQSAHDYAYWKQGQDPDVLDEFPAQAFIRVQDVRVPRPTHVANEGRVELKSDLDFWLAMNNPDFGGFGVPWGPWGFNSGMGVEDRDRDEAERLRLLSPGEAVTPVDRDFNDRLQAGVSNLSPDLISLLQSVFGDQISISDGTATWLGRQAGEPAADLPPAPGDTPAPEPPSPDQPDASDQSDENQSPVSDALDLSDLRGSMKRNVSIALDLIDSVHDDGDLPDLPIERSDRRADYDGVYRFSRSGDPIHIEINPTSETTVETTIHEVGHFLDHQGIGQNAFASVSSPLLSAWRDAVSSSPEIQALRALPSTRQTRYLLDTREIWARAYTQYIAMTTGDPELTSQIEHWRLLWGSNSFWTPETFAPIRDAITKALQEKGWL